MGEVLCPYHERERVTKRKDDGLSADRNRICRRYYTSGTVTSYRVIQVPVAKLRARSSTSSS